MSLIKRIPMEKVELGMYVSDQTPGLEDGELRPQGFIRRWETVDKLTGMGLDEIYIDAHRGLDSPFSSPIQPDGSALTPKVGLEKERQQAQKIYAEAKGLVTDILNNVKVGKAIDVGPVEELADEINSSVLNNHNALLCLAAIREKDQYLLEHSINVGILMGIFTRFLGYEQEMIHQLVTGALLHDIGKIRVPSRILNKPGKLSDDEWGEMKRHVAYGQEVLLKSEGITEVALSICGMHHERLDGSGYPLALEEFKINNYGRLAAIVDIYDAMTADRVYHKGKTPAEAMTFLHELAGHHLDRKLVTQFSRCMSVYPVGTFVQLNNGKAGVVVSTVSDTPDTPIVNVFYDVKTRLIEKAVSFDLSLEKNEFTIVEALDPEEFGVNTNDFL
ncbi:HD-GYP domain-containing protein [Teredinibacter purpureus]|uniref:HD-GYP domain-containing protein n=1 Tax=Teredinibacter purpureus TaxID=2731756 RepID=UPI0005F770A5|nr:HD-GYP domain-containing protein [Teredinibacter purpureus]